MSRVKDVALEVKDSLKQDNVPVISGGIAYFGFLALFPALAATISIYGLVADPADITRQIQDAMGGAPESTRLFLTDQLTAIAQGASGGLGLTAVIGILAALWSASAAVKHVIATLNQIYGLRETRGFVALRGTALLFTFGAVVLFSASLFALAVLPGLLAALDLGTVGRILIGIARFPVLILLMSMAISVLFNLGPNRPTNRFRLTTPGAITGTIVWIVASGLLSIYTANVDKFSGAAGLLGAITALMLWLYVTAFCVFIGAEVDVALETIEARNRAAQRERIEVGYEKATRSDKGRAALAGTLLGVALGAATRKATGR